MISGLKLNESVKKIVVIIMIIIISVPTIISMYVLRIFYSMGIVSVVILGVYVFVIVVTRL